MTMVFTWFRAYSFRHPHFPSLHQKASALASSLRERSPTPALARKPLLRWTAYSPDHSRRNLA